MRPEAGRGHHQGGGCTGATVGSTWGHRELLPGLCSLVAPGERGAGCQARPHVRAGGSEAASAVPPPPRSAARSQHRLRDLGQCFSTGARIAPCRGRAAPARPGGAALPPVRCPAPWGWWHHHRHPGGTGMGTPCPPHCSVLLHHSQGLGPAQGQILSTASPGASPGLSNLGLPASTDPGPSPQPRGAPVPAAPEQGLHAQHGPTGTPRSCPLQQGPRGSLPPHRCPHAAEGPPRAPHHG